MTQQEYALAVAGVAAEDYKAWAKVDANKEAYKTWAKTDWPLEKLPRNLFM